MLRLFREPPNPVFPLISAIVLTLCACGPPYHIGNKVPAFPPTAEPQYEGTTSYISMRVGIDGSPLKSTLAKEIPAHFDESGSDVADKLRWNFDRISGPNVSFSDGRLVVDASYKGDIETRGAFGGCHLRPVYPRITISTGPEIYQKGDNWIFGPRETKIKGDLLDGSDTGCTLINFPVEDRILNFLNGDTVNDRIFSALDKAKFTIAVPDAVKAIDGPFVLPNPLEYSRADVKFCLYPAISVLAVGGFDGDLNDIQALFVARAKPVMAMTILPGEQCKPFVRPPEDAVFLAAAPPGLPPITRIKLSMLVGTEDLSLLLKMRYLPPEFYFEGHRILIHDVEVSGANGKMLIRLELNGYVNGNVYFWGTPVLNSRGTAIEVPDVQMSAESQHLLDAAKFGLADLFAKAYIDSLKKYARLDFENFYYEKTGTDRNLLEVLKKRLTRSVNSGPATIDIRVTDAKVDSAWILKLPDKSSAFHLIVDLTGTLDARIRVPSHFP